MRSMGGSVTNSAPEIRGCTGCRGRGRNSRGTTTFTASLGRRIVRRWVSCGGRSRECHCSRR